MKKLINKLFLLLFLSSCTISAQTEGYSRKDRIAYEEADSYIDYGDYYTALKQFERIYVKDSLNPWLNYKMGYSAYMLNDFDIAKGYLERGLNTTEDASYYLAAVLHYQSKTEEAERIISQLDSEELTMAQEEVSRLKKQIEFTKKQYQNPEDVTIQNIGDSINSEYPEYVPLITADQNQLFFTSRRPVDKKSKLDPTGQYYESVFYAINKNGVWAEAEEVKGSINTPRHDACVGLSPDGKRMFLFKTNSNLVGGDLYESKEINGFWSVPLKLTDKVNGEYSIERSASISLNERVLYFSSNREGGYGGFDLYRVVLLPNGEWSEAMNLGPQINTAYDDDAPFIHPDENTLYFSSKGHNGMGGYDVFKTTLGESGQVGDIINLGYPINTTTDDIYFVISANGNTGYYSSAKKGGFGDQDIYTINYLEKSLKQSVVNATIPEIVGANLVAKVSLLDYKSEEIVGIFSPRADDGSFIFLVDPNVKYKLVIEVEGFDERIQELIFTEVELIEEPQLKFELTRRTQ